MYFSPTKSGEKIAMRLSSVLNAPMINITLPSARFDCKVVSEMELLYVIVPVYGQNIPQVLKSYFRELLYTGKVVLIAVYGGVRAGGTLKYLQRYFNGRVVAGAYFIGEHSYNNSHIRLGVNRPNEADFEKLNELVILAEKRFINNTTITLRGRSNVFALMIPRFILKLSSQIPAIKGDCKRCMYCQLHCPTASINADLSIKKKTCCHCYCCVTLCKENNRQKKIFLNTNWYLKRCIKREKNIKIF